MNIGQIMAECDCTHDPCLARGYCMATRIAKLERRLAEVTAERDQWKSAAGKALDGGLEAQLRSQAAEAMLPRAYRAGVEACARQCNLLDSGWEDEMGLIVYASAGYCADAIRALPTPTIEQLKAMTKESGDE